MLVSVITPLDKHKKNLIDFYTEQPEVPEDTWPPVSSSAYISLALIKQDSIHQAGEYGRSTIRGDADDIYKDKESLVYDKAFSGLKSGARLLVEGRPGSGKTTLVHKISQDWAREKLTYEHVRLLILVHLRAFSSDPNVSLRDILKCYFRYPSINEEILEYAETNSGLGFCFILDGLDEYLPNDDNAYIFQLIKKLVLPKSITIVASRPAAAAKFRPKASRQVEVIGFLKEQISEYINNYPFSNLKHKNLHQYLDQHPNIHHMCYLPIHAAMVCFLFDYLGSDLPQTETKIYNEFTKFTILRILRRFHEVNIDSVEDLAGPQKEVYYKVCQLAYEMCKSSKQVMTQAEAQSIFNAQDEKDCLGLITVDKMAMLCGFQKMYTFLHLTFQEFLGAFYIANLEEEEQMKLIVELGKAEQMQQVWKFYCGLSMFDAKCKKFEAIIRNTEYGGLFKIQCCFESQQSRVCDTVVDGNCLSLKDTFLSPSNFTEIAFILSNTCLNPVLSFERCVFGKECVDVLIKKAKDKLTALCFRNSNFEDLKNINYFLQSSNSLELLDISDLMLRKEDIKMLTMDLKNSNLRILKVGGRGTPLYSSLTMPQMLADAFRLNCNDAFNICFSGIGGNHIITNSLENLPFHFHCDYPDLNLIATKLSLAAIKALSFDFWKHPYYTRVTLIGCGVDDVAASYLGLGLKYCKSLEILELSFNNIGDNGAIGIAESVKYSAKLIRIDFTHNKLSDKGALELADIFKGSSVRILFSDNGITRFDDIFQKCSNVQFHTLDISDRNLGDTGVERLTSIILSSCNYSDIIRLNLSVNSLSHLSMKPLNSVLAQCSNLDTLDLSSNALGLDGAEILSGALKHCDRLHIIDISFNCFGSSGAIAISRGLKCCTTLLQLKVNSNNIGGEGTWALVEALKVCFILQELEIRSNDIQCSGAKALAHAFSLEYWPNFCVLDISSNNIGNEGIKDLAKSLTQCTTLQELYLSNNSIQSSDANLLANSLQKFTNLQALDISCNNLQSPGAKIIADALHHSTSLCTFDISDNDVGTDGAKSIVNALQHWKKISQLNISCNSIEYTFLANALAHVSSTAAQNLSQLNISNNAMLLKRDDGAALGHCINIHEMNLSNNSVSKNFLHVLADSLVHFSSIQLLHLTSNKIGDAGVKILAKGLVHCTQLSELYISDNQIGDDGAIALAGTLKHLSNLHVIDVSSNGIEEKGATVFIEALRYCTKLHELIISGNRNIGIGGIEKLASIIQQSRTFRALMVSDINLGSEGTRFLARALKACINLQRLDISLNNIGADGAKALTEALKYCRTLRVFDASCNPLETDGAYALAGIFRYCTNVQELKLSNCEMSINLILFEVLQNCHNICSLIISENSFGTYNYDELAITLPGFLVFERDREGVLPIISSVHTNLSELCIDNCLLRSTGIKSIAKALTNLYLLDVSHNSIEDDGALVLADALKQNTRLHTLSLKANLINTSGATALAKALQHCTSLHIVDISSNLFGTEGFEVLKKSLGHCTQLTVD